MAKRIRALVKPEILKWVRKNAGISVERAAKKIQTKPEKIVEWENGVSRPTINQLRKLGNAYKRPIAVFFLPEPPKDFQPMRDFRRLFTIEDISISESPELKYEIRRAFELREIAIELYEDLEGQIDNFELKASVSDDPEEVASRIRISLNAKLEEQFKLSNSYQALNYWRNLLESQNILVLQAPRIDKMQMRGFSISEFPFPAIVVNNKDAPRGRIFTMLHELAHIMLKDGGLCDLDEFAERDQNEQRVEVFCNHVAGAVLIPKEHLLNHSLVIANENQVEWRESDLNILSNQYRASRISVLRRLLIFGKTSKEFYQMKQDEYASTPPYDSSDAIVPLFRKTVSKFGPTFISLILVNYYQSNITIKDVSDFLDIRIKHLPKIEKAVMGSSIMFGETA